MIRSSSRKKKREKGLREILKGRPAKMNVASVGAMIQTVLQYFNGFPFPDKKCWSMISTL